MPTMCGCSRALGAISALFASLAGAVLVAQDRCLDAGGRLSDTAWVCEGASGVATSLWSLVSPMTMGLVALGVGLPVYFGVNAIGNRFIAAFGKRQG